MSKRRFKDVIFFRVMLLCIFLIAATSASAQYTSRLGRFQVDQIRGCAPFTITITNTNLITSGECTPGKPCLMDYLGNNNQQQNTFTFIYTTPGVYKLSVLYQVIGSDDITVTVDANVPPPFDIYACGGSKVEINITDNTYDSYAIDFNNDGTVDKTIPSGISQTAIGTYAAPGSYTISVKGKKLNAANNCNANLQAYTALAALPPPVLNSLTAVDASTLQLAFTPQANIEYHAGMAFNNATNFQLIQSQPYYKINSLTLPNLSVDTKYYCVRLSTYDPCANTDTYSAPLCSQDLSLSISSGVNQLAWQTASTGISNIQVVRTAPTGQSFLSLPGTATSYNDNAIVCKTNYCYQLVSNYAGGATSTSLQKCGTSFYTDSPTAIDNTSVGVTNNNTQAQLSWLQDPAYTASTYNIWRSSDGITYGVIGNATSKQFLDTSYGGSECYKVTYVDNCDNKSADGAPACAIVLSGTVDNKNHVYLQWTNYTGWNLGVKDYIVEKFDQQGQPILSINVGTRTSFVDSTTDETNQIVFYKIIAEANEAGVYMSVSNEIRIVKGVNLWYPTAFNPESKSPYNRTFTVRGHFIATMQLQIFDRWGSLVFFSDQNEAWDGRRGGSSMPDATYVWTAQGTDQNGGAFKKAGTVVLIRK